MWRMRGSEGVYIDLGYESDSLTQHKMIDYMCLCLFVYNIEHVGTVRVITHAVSSAYFVVRVCSRKELRYRNTHQSKKAIGVSGNFLYLGILYFL